MEPPRNHVTLFRGKGRADHWAPWLINNLARPAANDRHQLLIRHRLYRDIATFDGLRRLAIQSVPDLLDGL